MFSKARIIDFTEDNQALTKDEELERVLAIASCLEHPERAGEGDAKNARKVLQWLSEVILPDGRLIANDEAPEDNSSAERQIARQQTSKTSERGLETINSLLSSETFSAIEPTQQLLLSFLAFTDSRDPWTTTSSQQQAEQLLDRYSNRTKDSVFLIDFVSQTFIRPLFSRSKPTAITVTGRKAMLTTNAPQKRYDTADLDPANKPWKFREVYAVTVFQWVVLHSSEDIITKSWHLFIPPILTLLDDPKTEIRVRGLEILASFLKKFPAKLLKQTGLGEVFEDAVMPILLYLPNLTPVDESVMLLVPAYDALHILVDARFPGDGEIVERMRSFEQIMRHGILQGYSIASEHPQIVRVLAEQLERIVSRMGVYGVKYLKDTIPMLSTILKDPFGASQPALLVSTSKALKATIVNCWPRISQPIHYLQIIEALALCWGVVIDEVASQTVAENKDILATAKEELQSTGRVLMAVGDAGDISREETLKPLLEADPQLREVFG